jgi:hypothetical protein
MGAWDGRIDHVDQTGGLEGQTNTLGARSGFRSERLEVWREAGIRCVKPIHAVIKW